MKNFEIDEDEVSAVEKANRLGEGTEQCPFSSMDGTAGIQKELDACSVRGGVVNLECGRYDIDRSTVLDTPSLCLSGGVWSCNTAISSCFFDAPGTFWYFENSATENNERQPSKIRIPAFWIVGDQTRICNNTFLNSSAESIQICGNGNILMGNIADGDVHICGEGNVVSGLVFATCDARLVLEGSAKTTTILHGVEDWRVIRK